MASNNLEDIDCIQFNITFHKDCPDFVKYTQNIRQIEQETQTDIQLLQIVRIKGDEDKVEQARQRIYQLNADLDQNEQENNKDQILQDVQKMILDFEREKENMARTIKKLENEIVTLNGSLMNYNGMNNDLKTIKNEVNVEMAKMSELVQKSQHNLNEGQVEIDENDCILSDEGLKYFYESRTYRFWNFIGRQPLHIAGQLGRLDVVAKLLRQGADINCKDDNGWTVLHNSAERGQLDIIMYLIENNAAINQQNNYGDTALMYAVIDGHKDVVEYLCSKKADIHIIANDNKTALDWAREYDYSEILEILEKYDNQT